VVIIVENIETGESDPLDSLESAALRLAKPPPHVTDPTRRSLLMVLVRHQIPSLSG